MRRNQEDDAVSAFVHGSGIVVDDDATASSCWKYVITTTMSYKKIILCSFWTQNCK